MNRLTAMVVIAVFLSLLFGCFNSKSNIPFGKYEFEFPFLYTFPLSVAKADYVTKGTDLVIGKDIFTITQNSNGQTLNISNPIYKYKRLDDNMMKALCKEMEGFDLSKYKKKYCYTVYKSKDVLAHMFPYSPKDKYPAIISLYIMDNELWLAPYWDKNSIGSEPYDKHDFIVKLKPKTDP